MGIFTYFITNYFIVKDNIEKIVTADLKTTVGIIYDAIDLHFSDPVYRKEFAANLETGSLEVDFDERFNELRYRIRRVKFGEHGYAYIINSKGDVIIHPELEGENLIKEQFIKDIIKNKNGIIEYKWKGDKKINAFKYFEPFGWIIIAGSNYEDFLSSPMRRVLTLSLSIICVVMAVMFVVLFRIISIMIIRPINKTKKIAEGIRDGDLTITLERMGSDEIGIMMASMSDILSNQRNIISAMAGHIKKLTLTSDEMAVISSKMSKMSQDQAAAMEETSAALEETLASMEQIAARSETQLQAVDQNAATMVTMASDAENSYAEAINVTNLITGTSENARLGEQELNRMVSEMQNIKESTSKIAEFIMIISDISEKVNLLSLNAAIEAARAGEHGRGFAVVADEISKLADQTAQSAKNITQLVNEGNTQVDSGTEIVNRTALAFHKIIESIESARQIISKFAGILKLLADTASETRERTDSMKKISNEISLSTKEQMSTNKEMSATVEKINTDSQELVNYADSILKTSAEIGELSAEIKTQINKFKIQ
jgi:methyl-accepting chemotaxis protein